MQYVRNHSSRNTQAGSIHLKPGKHQTSLGRQRKLRQDVDLQRRGLPRPACAPDLPPNLRMLMLPMVLFRPGNLRQLTHVFDCGLAKFVCNHRQQSVPRAIPQKSNIQIRRILPPALIFFAQEFPQIDAANAQQRTYHFARNLPVLFKNNQGMNTREPTNAGSPKDAEEHRFRLIVESVRRSNLRDTALPRQLAEKPVPQFTSRCFATGSLADWGRRGFSRSFKSTKFQSILRSQLRDKTRIFV